MTLAAQVAAENDPQKFHTLILQLHRMLDENIIPIRGTGKTLSQPPPK